MSSSIKAFDCILCKTWFLFLLLNVAAVTPEIPYDKINKINIRTWYLTTKECYDNKITVKCERWTFNKFGPIRSLIDDQENQNKTIMQEIKGVCEPWVVSAGSSHAAYGSTVAAFKLFTPISPVEDETPELDYPKFSLIFLDTQLDHNVQWLWARLKAKLRPTSQASIHITCSIINTCKYTVVYLCGYTAQCVVTSLPGSLLASWK